MEQRYLCWSTSYYRIWWRGKIIELDLTSEEKASFEKSVDQLKIYLMQKKIDPSI